MKASIRFILSDLDGVIRHFPAERDESIERKFNLPPGTLAAAAFEKGILLPAVTGLNSDEAWRDAIVRSLQKRFSHDIARVAVQEWSAFPGEVDWHYLQWLRLEFVEIPICILTNGTSRLLRDLDYLGLQGEFFRIFNSSEIGYCKPDARIYQHVIKELDCQPDEILYIDDSLSHVQAAQGLRMRALHYRSLDELSRSLAGFR